MTAADTGTILRRVQALLAKADSTEYEEEAEALRVKASALIATHGITETMLVADGKKQDNLDSTVIWIQGSYSHDQAALLGYIAHVFNCKIVQHRARDTRVIERVTLIGYRSDIEIVEGLFRIINTQAIHGSGRLRIPHYENVKTYRKSWWFGFSTMVYRRLKDAQDTAVTQARATSSGTSAELVLIDRADRVEHYKHELFPSLRKSAKRVARSNDGYHDGRAAGRRADLGQTRIGGQRAVIGQCPGC